MTDSQVTQDCLDKTVLQIEDPDGVRIGTQYNITNFRPITLELQVLLPPGIRCTQCVLQWRYVAGMFLYCIFAFFDCLEISVGKIRRGSPL